MTTHELNYTLPGIAAAFAEQLKSHNPQRNISDITDTIYLTYAELQGRDPEDIQQGFMELEKYM